MRKVTGQTKQFKVSLKGAKAGQKVKVSYVDMERGSPYPAWARDGLAAVSHARPTEQDQGGG